MTRTKKILAWILLLCMILGMVPSMAVSAGAEDAGEPVVINAMGYGADPTGAVDSTEAIWAALQAAKELEADGHSVILEFPKGEYHIYKDRAQTREYHTSNTNSIENPVKTIGILIEEHENLTLDGNGSLFMMHGNMMALAVVKSENITLKDFSWDFAVPTVTELTVTASGSDYTEYYIPECFPYTISGNTLVWSSELSPYTGRPYWTATGNHNTYAVVAHHPDDEMTRNFGTDISPFTNATGITDVGNNVIRITYSYKNSTQQAHHKPGTVIALCGNAHRETAGAFTWESRNVLAEGVNVHFMHGFGWLIQMSEDVTYRNCNLMPRENSGHLTVSFADGLHASGAAGEIVVENCNFSNTHDDPINFHGTFTRVEQRIDDNTLKLAYIHNQQGGFPQFHVGDRVAFFTRDTLESSDHETLYTVAEVVSDPGEDGNDLRTMVVRFEEVLPAFLSNTVSNGSPKYVAENVTYAPAVTIKGCTFKNVATRGILCTTRNPVLIEGNTFRNMSMATIFLSNDSNDWYESGPIRDMTIRNNTFYIKTIGDTYWDYKSAVYIHPVTYGGGLPSADNPIHKNITIEGNTFHMSDDTVVKAESVENLIIRNNTILRTDPEFEITLSGVGGDLDVGQTRQLSVAATGTTIIGDNNKNLSDTTSRNYDNVFEFTACKNVIIEGNTYDDGMKNYAVVSDMPEAYITNKDGEISLVTSSSMPAGEPVSDLVYVSTDPDVVSVNASGQVTAMTGGNAEVYAYYVWNGTVVKSNALTFTVGSGTGSQPDNAVVSLADTLVLTADNATAQLTPPGENTGWTVTDFYTGAASTAATVSDDGVVTAVSGGIVWVTATSGSTVVKTPVVISMSQISQLNSHFEIKKPDTANYALREDSVVITQKGGNDLWTYDNTLENLFLYDDFDTADLRTVVKVEGLPVRANNNWDTASFLLFAGYDDYVSIGKKGHKNGFATVVEQAQVCSEYEESSTANNDVTTAYVGFTVQNGTVSMDYSLDGTTWVTAKTADAAFLGSSYKIGLAAWGTGGNDITFSQFRVGKASEVSYEQLAQQPAIPVLRNANQAPVASGVAFGADRYQVGEKAAVTFNFADADGDDQGECLYLWSYAQAGTVHTAVTNVPEFTVPASGGLTCAVYPVDSLGMPGAPAEAAVDTASGEVNLALSSLTVNGASLNVEGGAAAFEVVIPADLNKVEMRYQSLMGDEGTTTLTVGSNTVTRGNNDRVGLDITGADTITITRSAEGMADKVYTVSLIRAESNATNIQGIEIPELAFSATDLSAGYWTNRTTKGSATLKVLSDDSIGRVEVRYNHYRTPITMTKTANGYEGTIDFVTGLNSYYIVVVAKDGITTKQYNVNVVCTPDTTSQLQDVKLNGVSLEGFSPDRYEYLVDFNGIEALTVEAVTDQRVRIRIGDAYILEDSGKKSLTADDLKGGCKVYIVTVADDGIVRQTYTVNMVAFENEDVTLKPGETATFTDASGYYVGADTSGLDTDVATVTITGTVTASEKALSQPVTSLVSGRQYLIVNTRANKPVTNVPASAAAAAGAGSGLSLSGSTDTIADAAIWNITAVNGGYTVQDLGGMYMTIGSNSAGTGSSEAQLELNYNGSTWTIAQNGAYLNHFGGGSSTCAAGWQDAAAAGDDGSQWAIYEVQEIPTEGTTQITFTGVGAGKASVQIGNTIYNITVTEAPHEHVFDQQNTDNEYLATPADCENAATYYYSCSCGEKGTETFTHGEALGHDNVDGVCTRCGELLGVIRVAGANRWATALLVADEMKAALGDEKFDAIIIASGNDFADALAGSYLATVKNAPILLSYGGDNEKYAYLDNDNINYVKENLAEDGVVYILGGEKAVPTLYEDGLEGYDVVRLGGANRFETNILILEEAGIADGAEVLVCTSANFADSLSASATGKPILLVWNDSGALYGSQPEFLEELKEKNCTFTILGGENAVSAKLADEVAKYGEVDRLAGNTRMETSVLVAEKYFDAPETAVLAYAWNYPDGLCGGSLAYALKAPLILTMPKYEAAAVEYAAENDITVGFVLGGDGLIGDAEVRAIFAMAAADQIVVKN